MSSIQMFLDNPDKDLDKEMSEKGHSRYIRIMLLVLKMIK